MNRGNAALYFDPKKPEEMARCMEQIKNDISLREEKVRLGYKRAIKFNFETMTARYLEIFRTISEKNNN